MKKTSILNGFFMGFMGTSLDCGEKSIMGKNWEKFHSRVPYRVSYIAAMIHSQVYYMAPVIGFGHSRVHYNAPVNAQSSPEIAKNEKFIWTTSGGFKGERVPNFRCRVRVRIGCAELANFRGKVRPEVRAPVSEDFWKLILPQNYPNSPQIWSNSVWAIPKNANPREASGTLTPSPNRQCHLFPKMAPGMNFTDHPG